MGWENYHLFQFCEKDIMDREAIAIPYPDAEETKIFDARKKHIKSIFRKEGSRYTYLYDFGDNWEHEVLLEAITKEPCYRPFCIDGSGACPPEDVGGLGGYALMIEALTAKGHPEKKSYRKWIGLKKSEKWDVMHCSTREINKRLALLEIEQA